MARVRAATSRRETRRRRSVAMVAQALQLLTGPAQAPLTETEIAAIRERLERPRENRQGDLLSMDRGCSN